jgi:Nucleotidyltransferase/DNA polymerase involved in DNA repair
MSKPDGLLIVSEAETSAFLAGLPVRAMWGIGPKAADALESRGIRTVADIRSSPQQMVDRILGPAGGARIRRLAAGEDAREVQTERAEKSIGHEETFLHDISDRAALRSELRRLSDKVGRRLRDGAWEAAGIALKLRYADFTTISRSTTLTEPTDVGQRIGDLALGLFDALELSQPVRLIGVRAERLRHGGSAAPALWDDDEHWRRVDSALDGARDRFGGAAVMRASVLGPRRDVNALPTNPRLPREH